MGGDRAEKFIAVWVPEALGCADGLLVSYLFIFTESKDYFPFKFSKLLCIEGAPTPARICETCP